jgi:hypothetical protein
MCLPFPLIILLHIHVHFRSRDSVIGIDTKQHPGQSGVWIPTRVWHFSVCHIVPTSCGVHPTSCSVDTNGSFSKGKVVGPGGWPLPSIQCWGSEWMELYNYSPHVLMVCRGTTLLYLFICLWCEQLVVAVIWAEVSNFAVSWSCCPHGGSASAKFVCPFWGFWQCYTTLKSTWFWA